MMTYEEDDDEPWDQQVTTTAPPPRVSSFVTTDVDLDDGDLPSLSPAPSLVHKKTLSQPATTVASPTMGNKNSSRSNNNTLSTPVNKASTDTTSTPNTAPMSVTPAAKKKSKKSTNKNDAQKHAQRQQFWKQLDQRRGSDSESDDEESTMEGPMPLARPRSDFTEEDEDDDYEDDMDSRGTYEDEDEEPTRRRRTRITPPSRPPDEDEYSSSVDTMEGSLDQRRQQRQHKKYNAAAASGAIAPMDEMGADEDNFCGQTLTALTDICGISGPTIENEEPPQQPKKSKKAVVQAARDRLQRSASHKDENTAIEVEFVEPPSGLSSRSRDADDRSAYSAQSSGYDDNAPSSRQEQERKNAVLAAMARKAQQNFEQSSMPTSPRRDEPDPVTSPEDLYAQFSAPEKRKFLKHINQGIAPLAAAQLIQSERQNPTSPKSTTGSNKAKTIEVVNLEPRSPVSSIGKSSVTAASVENAAASPRSAAASPRSAAASPRSAAASPKSPTQRSTTPTKSPRSTSSAGGGGSRLAFWKRGRKSPSAAQKTAHELGSDDKPVAEKLRSASAPRTRGGASMTALALASSSRRSMSAMRGGRGEQLRTPERKQPIPGQILDDTSEQSEDTGPLPVPRLFDSSPNKVASGEVSPLSNAGQDTAPRTPPNNHSAPLSPLGQEGTMPGEQSLLQPTLEGDRPEPEIQVEPVSAEKEKSQESIVQVATDESNDMDMDTYLNSTDVYSAVGGTTDAQSVYTSATAMTGVSISTTRKRRPGAAKKRLEKEKSMNKKQGWHETMQTAAASANRQWESDKGFEGYEDIQSESILDAGDDRVEKIRLNLDKVNRKESNAPDPPEKTPEKVEVPFPAEWERERQSMAPTATPSPVAAKHIPTPGDAKPSSASVDGSYLTMDDNMTMMTASTGPRKRQNRRGTTSARSARSVTDDRPRGWMESMKMATSAISLDGQQHWDPERGWKHPALEAELNNSSVVGGQPYSDVADLSVSTSTVPHEESVNVSSLMGPYQERSAAPSKEAASAQFQALESQDTEYTNNLSANRDVMNPQNDQVEQKRATSAIPFVRNARSNQTDNDPPSSPLQMYEQRGRSRSPPPNRKGEVKVYEPTNKSPKSASYTMQPKSPTGRSEHGSMASYASLTGAGDSNAQKPMAPGSSASGSSVVEREPEDYQMPRTQSPPSLDIPAMDDNSDRLETGSATGSVSSSMFKRRSRYMQLGDNGSVRSAYNTKGALVGKSGNSKYAILNTDSDAIVEEDRSRDDSFPSLPSELRPAGSNVNIVTEKVGEEDMELFPQQTERRRDRTISMKTSKSMRELDGITGTMSRTRSGQLEEKKEESVGPVDLDDALDDMIEERSNAWETRSTSTTSRMSKSVPKLRANKRDTSPVSVTRVRSKDRRKSVQEIDKYDSLEEPIELDRSTGFNLSTEEGDSQGSPGSATERGGIPNSQSMGAKSMNSKEIEADLANLERSTTPKHQRSASESVMSKSESVLSKAEMILAKHKAEEDQTPPSPKDTRMKNRELVQKVLNNSRGEMPEVPALAPKEATKRDDGDHDSLFSFDDKASDALRKQRTRSLNAERSNYQSTISKRSAAEPSFGVPVKPGQEMEFDKERMKRLLQENDDFSEDDDALNTTGEGSTWVEGSEAYGPSAGENRTFLQRLTECAAPVMNGELPSAHLAFLRSQPASSAPEKDSTPFGLCGGRPDVIHEEDDEDDASHSGTEQQNSKRESKSNPLRKMDTERPEKAGSVVSDSFGAKTAYLDAIAMKTAVSKPKKGRRKGKSSGSSVVSGVSTTSNHSEKWKSFLERKKASLKADEAENRTSVSDVSKAAERLTATKLQEMRSKSAPRTGRDSANSGNLFSNWTGRSQSTTRPRPQPVVYKSEAEELAAARMDAMRTATEMTAQVSAGEI